MSPSVRLDRPRTARLPVPNPARAALRIWLAVLAILLGCTAPAWAQLDSGSIAGTIFDPAGKVVEGAKVSVRGVDTGSTYAAISSASGYYVFPTLRTGTYDITVAAPGFKSTIKRGVVVAVGARSAQDVTLAVGTASETISVDAGAQTLEADSSTIDASVQPDQINRLPLTITGGFRSLETLVSLVPGTVGVGVASDGTDTLKISGGQELGTDFLIDGITTNRQQNGSGSFGILSPSVDAVNEFHVSISSLPIEEGRTTGGISNFNTKGGTNTYHGTLYEFYKNAALDANSWFYNGYIAQQGDTAAARETYKRPQDTKNDYGGSFGGPLRIPRLYNGQNKSFFFFNWEQWHQNYGGTITSQLPTPAELGSDGQYFDFSSLLGAQLGTSPCGEAVYAGEIFDPEYDNTTIPCRYAGFGQSVTGTSGNYTVSGSPTNKIPITRASTVAMNFVNTYLMPLAKQEVSGNSSYNYAYRSPGVVTNTAYSFRIDQNIGEKHKIWGFWSSRENTDSGGNSNMPPPIQTCCGTVDQLGKLFRAGWDWVISPSVINSLTVGGNRSNNINKSKASKMGTDWDQKFGIANGFSDDFPVFEFYSNTFGSMGQQEDSTDVDNVVALNDIIHWQHGAHSFTLGAEGQYHQYSWVSHIGGTCSGNAGCFEYWDNQTASDEDFWGQDGNSFAAFLIGETGLATNLNDLHAPRWIMHSLAVFASDSWKVKPNLTVNVGLRWSYDTPRHEAEGDTANWDPTLTDEATTAGMYPQAKGALVFGGKGAGRNGSQNETWASVYKKDFEPRVGFAWKPSMFSDKAVIRGSAGIYYGPLVYADYGQGSVQGFTVSGNLYTTDPLDGVPLDAGLAALPTTPDLNANQLDGTSTSADYIAKSNGRPGMVENWALETQYQITPHLFATVGYIGNHATHLHGMLDFKNDMPDKYMELGDWLNWWAYYPGTPTGVGTPMEPYANFSCASGCTWPINEPEYQALRPYPQVEYINMDSYLQNLGQSTYEALEARLEQRFHNGLNILASYTFSKTLTDADVIQPYWSTLQNGGAVQDPENLRGEKAVSSEDIPNNFVLSYVYDLPLGRGKHFLSTNSSVLNAVVANWSVGGIHHYQGGQPISIYGATGIPGKNSSVRFDRVAGQAVKNKSYKNPLEFSSTSNATACATGYFNCDAFYDPNLFQNRDPDGVGSTGQGNPWRFGTMPRNSSDIRGFGYYDEDFSISKLIPIRDRIKIDFRGEMFDAFNRHIFTRPVSDLSSTVVNVGQIGGLQLGPRQVQFQLRITY
ncbi:MAG: carboxypeptidase-like regulatory domain-containing protein [Acidobacteriaceae bacterium]|nr:carboxypeptidase-like regulatory domain-containing protein [Acidobacteriaceae bacterium]